MFEAQNISFSYKIGDQTIDVLKNLNFSVKSGEFIGIQGPSGSGKSTLFYILGLLLKPTQGLVFLEGTNITALSQDDLTIIRNQRIGFIFQQFHLLPNTNCLKNILLPSVYPIEIKQSNIKKEKKARQLAHQLGLSQHLSHLPNQLSGGQQQRVAIARALIQDVDLILADEPTGNLDSKTAQEIMELLRDLNHQGKTIILITHDSEVAKFCSKIYHLKDGAFTHFEKNTNTVVIPLKKVLIPNKNISKLPQQRFLLLYYQMFRATLPLVFENLLRNKIKSLLTMMGVVIGVAAVLAMITLGQFSKIKILETYETLGVNKLLIRGYPNWNLKATDAVSVNFQSFHLERDLWPLKKIFPEIELITPLFYLGQNNAASGGLRIENQVETLGVNAAYLWIANRSLVAGTHFSPYHIEKGSPVCLIGYGIAQRLFSNRVALHQVLQITDMYRLSFHCRVIGVLASQTSPHDRSPPDLQVLIPYSYFQSVAPSWWSKRAYQAALQIAPGADIENTGLKIRGYFEQKYGKSGKFYIDSDSALLAQMKKFLNIFTLLLTSIACLSLLVGGIGINNMILVSVNERIHEFGIRKALGATHQSIRLLVLLESLSICTIAGLIGLVFGFFSYELLILGATRLVPNFQFEWILVPSALFLSFCSILFVGIFSGLIPAIQAEKLQIIEALRTE